MPPVFDQCWAAVNGPVSAGCPSPSELGSGQNLCKPLVRTPRLEVVRPAAPDGQPRLRLPGGSRVEVPSDPRIDFIHQLRALRKATGLSIRELEEVSRRTAPRDAKGNPVQREGGEPLLRRGTIGGMTSLSDPVLPEKINFEAFIDTCLRAAAEKNIRLLPGVDSRHAWDQGYREIREQVDRYQRRPALRALPEPTAEMPTPTETGSVAEGEPSPPPLRKKPPPSRRPIVLGLAVGVGVVGVGTGVTISSVWTGGSGSPVAEPLPSPSSSPATGDAYSPVGKLLSPSIAQDDHVWSVALGALKGESAAIVGRADGTVQLWNPVTGKPRSVPLAGHSGPVFSVALDGSLAVSASTDGTLRVWDLTTDPPTSTRLGDRLARGINSVALGTMNGRKAAVSASDDRTVRRWDPTQPRLTGTILGAELDSEVKSIAVGTINGEMIAVSGSADGTVRRWDVNTGQAGRLLGSHDRTVGTMAIGTVRGRTLAVSGGDDGDVRTWDLTTATPIGRPLGNRINEAIKTVAVGTASGRTVAIAGSDDDTIRIWDLATGRPYGTGLTGPDVAAESIAASNLGSRALVVSGHWDGTIWTWSL